MSDIVQKIRDLNKVFQKSVTTVLPLTDLCGQLSNIIDSNIYIFYATGEIFAFSFAQAFECPHNTSAALNETGLPDYYLELFHASTNSCFNIFEPTPKCTCKGVKTCRFKDRYFSIVPVFADVSKSAGILLVRYGRPFQKDEAVLCEYTAAIISLELIRQEQVRVQQEELERTQARLVASMLSFSELKATGAVLALMEGDEGTIFLKAVADQIYATQSLVTGALKKLESANVIQTRSRGVKGKFICITNRYLFEEVERALGEKS